MYAALMTATSAPAAAAPARRRPVSLAALRGFEAAARRLSFTLAADELALTQSSVSRQIASLESQIGKALFVRQTRSLALTAAGARLQAAVVQALSVVDECVAEIRGVGLPPRVSLSTYASFASLWLVPRLAGFQREQPQIEIRIDASDRLIDLDAEGLDLAIRRCLPEQVAGQTGVTLLGDEHVTPALSPQLIERSDVKLKEPGDLSRLPLIEMDDHRPSARAGTWQRWFDAVGASPLPAQAGRLSFSYLDQAVQAAIRGQGVVIGRSPLLDDAIANGQLTTPFPDLRFATGYRYYLVVARERSQSAEVTAFVRWLVDEFGRAPQRSS
jgi:DNA-binding transcriptional LysR family regulator